MPKIPTLLVLLALSACGTRGALYIPPGPPSEPVLGGKPTPMNQASTSRKAGPNNPAASSATTAAPAAANENTSTDKKAPDQ